jgi:hypothetical protein
VWHLVPDGANLSPFTTGEGVLSLASVSCGTDRGRSQRARPEIRREGNGSPDQIGTVDHRLDGSHLMKSVDPVDRP